MVRISPIELLSVDLNKFELTGPNSDVVWIFTRFAAKNSHESKRPNADSGELHLRPILNLKDPNIANFFAS
jgi:hypothetical protein